LLSTLLQTPAVVRTTDGWVEVSSADSHDVNGNRPGNRESASLRQQRRRLHQRVRGHLLRLRRQSLSGLFRAPGPISAAPRALHVARGPRSIWAAPQGWPRLTRWP